MSGTVQENTRITPNQQTSLTREQKEAVGLLSVGTFLEYFDLMLYIHMAALLNELFFEPTDPKTTSLMRAFAFCSTFVFRPIGAVVFGWLGDNIGRKATVELTELIKSYDKIDDKLSKKLVDLIIITTNAYETFRDSTVAEKRELLSFMFANLNLNGSNLKYTLAFPFTELAKLTNCPIWRRERDSNPRYG